MAVKNRGKLLFHHNLPGNWRVDVYEFDLDAYLVHPKTRQRIVYSVQGIQGHHGLPVFSLLIHEERKKDGTIGIVFPLVAYTVEGKKYIAVERNWRFIDQIKRRVEVSRKSWDSPDALPLPPNSGIVVEVHDLGFGEANNARITGGIDFP